jgi:hypothetical protein
VRSIEAAANPKEILEDACKVACGKSGARLKAASRNFPRYRATLIERLDLDGPVNELASWRRFVEDLTVAAQRIMSDSAGA